MYSFLEFPSILKLSEHGTRVPFNPTIYRDENAEDVQMEIGQGPFEFRPPSFGFNDVNTKNNVFNNSSCKFQSMASMPEYYRKSFEELRYEDYLLNRRGKCHCHAMPMPCKSHANSMPCQCHANFMPCQFNAIVNGILHFMLILNSHYIKIN